MGPMGRSCCLDAFSFLSFLRNDASQIRLPAPEPTQYMY